MVPESLGGGDASLDSLSENETGFRSEGVLTQARLFLDGFLVNH